MDLVVHGLADGVGEPGEGQQLVHRGLLDRFDPAQLLDQALAAGVAQALDPVEDAGGHALAPKLAVVGDGEAVGLVPQALQHVEGFGLAGDADGIGLAGHEDLFEALGQAGDGDLVLQPEGLDHPLGHVELAPAAVDHQQVGRVGELPRPPRSARQRPVALGDQGGEAAGEHLLHGGEVVVAGHVLDPEPAVVALLGQAVLHHNHRPDVVRPLDVAHVEALDAQGGVGQVQRVLEGGKGSGPGVVVGRPPQPVADELLPGVLGDGRLQGPLVAPLGHPDRHPGPSELAQELPVDLGVGRLVGHQDLVGDGFGLGLGVEALQHPAHQPAGRHVLHQVEDEALAAHHPAPAHEEDLDRHLQLVTRHPDDIEVLRLLGDDRLLLDGLAHAGQAVAQAGRPLVLLDVGRLPHLLVELVDDRLGVAVEELDQVLDQPFVLGLVDLAHARSLALLDVKEQAGASEALVVGELVVTARADGERAQEQVERLPDGVGVGEGAEVPDVLALLAPHDHGPGPLVAHGDGEEGVALVVPQADVEPGPVLLDEAVLEHEGLDVVADLDPLHRLGRRHHLGGAGRQ